MNRKQKNDLETSVHSVSSVAMAFYAGREIVQTPSERFETRAKCQTLSSESSGEKFPTPSGKSAITQTVSAQSVSVKFTHADAGQMNLYLNYATEHLMEPGENAPVGMILCSAKNNAVVHYAMGGIKANVFASRYMTVLPDEETLRMEIVKTQRAMKQRCLPESRMQRRNET